MHGSQNQSKKWLETNRKITRLKEESKRTIWHKHLVRTSKSKVAKQALSTVRSLSVKESRTTGKSILYRGRVYASNRSEVSTYVQEYAEISGRKSDKDSRKAIMDLLCPTRSTRTTPRQQIEEAFTPVNVSRCFLN